MTETKKDQNNTEPKDTTQKESLVEELELSSSNTAEEGGDSAEETLENSQKQTDRPEEDLKEDSLATYEELVGEVAELKDHLLRAVAEAENVRRRTEREKADASKYAVTNFARSILSVADNLSRALESVTQEGREASEEINNLCVGIEITGNELDNVYEQFGIKPIDALGKRFDHNFHQAMFEVDDPEQPAGFVVQQIQKGYTIHGRLLRPTMVAVSKGGPNAEDTLDKEDNIPSESSKGKSAKDPLSAYAKQADAVSHETEPDSPQVDKKL